MANFPLISILGLATWYITNQANKKVKDAQKLNLVPVRLTGSNVNNIFLDFQITNASESEFKIDSLTANIYYKENLIGTVYRTEPFLIKPTNNSIVKFGVKLQPGQSIATVLTLLFSKATIEKKFKILGAFKYFGLTFPLDKEINFNVSK